MEISTTSNKRILNQLNRLARFKCCHCGSYVDGNCHVTRLHYWWTNIKVILGQNDFLMEGNMLLYCTVLACSRDYTSIDCASSVIVHTTLQAYSQRLSSIICSKQILSSPESQSNLRFKSKLQSLIFQIFLFIISVKICCASTFLNSMFSRKSLTLLYKKTTILEGFEVCGCLVIQGQGSNPDFRLTCKSM